MHLLSWAALCYILFGFFLGVLAKNLSDRAERRLSRPLRRSRYRGEVNGEGHEE
jgi:hypothetical protein